MSALILMMLKDDTDALEEEIADIFKLLNLPEHRHIAVCPQNRLTKGTSKISSH